MVSNSQAVETGKNFNFVREKSENRTIFIQWFSFKNSSSERGEIFLQLHLSFATEGNLDHVKAHKRLLRVLMAHELVRLDPKPYSWRDDFSAESLAILAQHAVQGRMNRDETALVRWAVYCKVHAVLPLDYRVFTPVLDKLRKRSDLIRGGDEAFEKAASDFAADCVAFVRRHRIYMRDQDDNENEELHGQQLDHALKSLHVIHCIR